MDNNLLSKLRKQILDLKIKKRDEIIISQCKERNIPIQISMGGGYSESIDEITLAHCNTYSTAKEIFF